MIFLLLLVFVFLPLYHSSAVDIQTFLSGKILIQVESHGEAWYVNPANGKRYFLGRPNDAFSIMKKLGRGINNSDINKIQIGLIDSKNYDSDQDGLTDLMEEAIGTDKYKKDSDGDGYDDKTEIINGYNPAGLGKMPINNKFTSANSGSIFLQTEKNGQAWYVNPTDNKRYFLGRPDDAFDIMKRIGLGITNSNLEKIAIDNLTTPSSTNNGNNVIYSTADAIRAKNKNLASSYFIPVMKKKVEYAVENMSDESLLMLGNILSGSKLENSSDLEKKYTNTVYFPLGDQDVVLNFYVKKQPDGNWLLTNL